MSRKSIDAPVSEWLSIIVSFLFGLLDMTLLSESIKKLSENGDNVEDGMSLWVASLAALGIATIANTLALTWGIFSAKNQKRKKKELKYFIPALVCCLGWMVLGVGYFLIRLNTMEKTTDWIMIGVLAVSYITTGIVIYVSSKDIFDEDVRTFKKSQKRIERATRKIDKITAVLDEMQGNLSGYNENYVSLDKQAKKIHSRIHDAERAAMSEINGKVLTQNPGVNPRDVAKVMEEVLNENKKNEEELL